VQVNKTRDFIERVLWTAVQAAAATALATGFDDWSLTGKVSGIAALVAALKVVTAQQVGDNGSGDAIPGGVTQ
jgi:propanediol dehydratase large subunit